MWVKFGLQLDRITSSVGRLESVFSNLRVLSLSLGYFFIFFFCYGSEGCSIAIFHKKNHIPSSPTVHN